MTTTAADVLERHYLEIRCELLNVAAMLDRIGRAEISNPVEGDTRMDQIRQAIEVLLESGFGRAEKIQMVFSDEYDSDWDRES